MSVSSPPDHFIREIIVEGYKSLSTECSFEVRPLTILAGANSSGKSSAVQPLLLLKQTLDASYDPGPLKLDGPNVRFSSAEQFFSRNGKGTAESFRIEIRTDSRQTALFQFKRELKGNLRLDRVRIQTPRHDVSLWSGMKDAALRKRLGEEFDAEYPIISINADSMAPMQPKVKLLVSRCFFQVQLELWENPYHEHVALEIPGSATFRQLLNRVIHVPGLRGNPERAYKKTGGELSFPGTFEVYVASVLANWKKERDSRLLKLSELLQLLGLTWKVDVKDIDDTTVELLVGRLPASKLGGKDLVSIADVGLGVSQVLPVLVALLVAERGQFVYIEQPELHLHPRAQVALAEVFAEAAIRGVRVVMETHSSTLLLGVQTLVAEGKLDPDLVQLHWFARVADGSTKVTSSRLERDGSFGAWPEDFDDVALQTQSRYLDAAESLHLKRG